MSAFSSINEKHPNKTAYVFDLDNTIYPEKDYLYQVYFQIAQFIEYNELIDSKELTAFLVKTFQDEGRKDLFNKLIAQYQLKPEYLENFLRLIRNARLPLKLLMYKEVLQLMQDLVMERKRLFILTNGNIDQQSNKIKQLEWNGLEQYITCYFANETKPKPAPDSMLDLLEKNNLKASEVLFIGDSTEDEACAKASMVDFINVSHII